MNSLSCGSNTALNQLQLLVGLQFGTSRTGDFFIASPGSACACGPCPPVSGASAQLATPPYVWGTPPIGFILTGVVPQPPLPPN